MPNNDPDYKPKLNKKVLLDYIPHGIDYSVFKPLSLENQGETLKRKVKDKEIVLTEFEEMLDFKKKLLNNKDYDFIIFFNNRNIRRKMPGDVILAFAEFNKLLTKEQKEKTVLIMHTSIRDDNGTDLFAVKQAISKHDNIIFSTKKFDPHVMNYVYNIVSVTINMASNEGYGLATAESLMAGTPIIANVTGGLQDQMGFVAEDGKYIDPEEHLSFEWGSNHDGRIRNHGQWVKPLFPTNRALVGSPPTPYIFDDRCDWMDAAYAMKYWYDKSEEERGAAGLLGRKYMLSTGMSAQVQGERFIDYINKSIEDFTSKKRFNIHTI